MEYKFIDISEPGALPVPSDLTPDEQAELIAQYKRRRTLERMADEYRDFDKQVANGITAERFLKELQEESQE